MNYLSLLFLIETKFLHQTWKLFMSVEKLECEQ